MKNPSYADLQIKIQSTEVGIMAKRKAIVRRCVLLKEKNRKELILLGGFLTGFLVTGPVFLKKKGKPVSRSYLLRRLVFSTLTIMNLSHYIRPVFRHFFPRRPT